MLKRLISSEYPVCLIDIIRLSRTIIHSYALLKEVNYQIEIYSVNWIYLKMREICLNYYILKCHKISNRGRISF